MSILKIKKPSLKRPNIKLPKLPFKKAASVVILAALVLGAVSVSGRHWEQVQANNKVQAAEALAAEQAQLQAHDNELKAKFQAKYDQLRMECEKGAGYHAFATYSTRQKLQGAPNCGPAKLEL